MENNTHEPEWTENTLASNRVDIAFKCDYPGCPKKQRINRTRYNTGLQIPSASPHPNP
jgi:hypothetical protein